MRNLHFDYVMTDFEIVKLMLEKSQRFLF